MMTLMIMITVVILIFTCLFKVDFKFKMEKIPKEQRKEKGWLNINGKKIF